MFQATAVFSGFSVDNLGKAKEFYTKTLGLDVSEEMGLQLHLPCGGKVFVYEKPNHEPATYTVLNFIVEDIEQSVDTLTVQGVKLEIYDGFGQDEKGISRGDGKHPGPAAIAWLKDPAGNILSLIQEK